MECTVTLRQAMKATSSGGQVFFRCNCANGKKQCQTNINYYVSVLRLVKCIIAVDATTGSPVKISRTMYVN